MTRYYFADNSGPEAHPNAIQGDDSWNGLYPTHQGGNDGPKRFPWNFNTGLLETGDRVSFARGGHWLRDNIGMFIEQPASSSLSFDDPIIFDDYDPGGGVEGMPFLQSSGVTFFLFGSYGGSGAPDMGGFIVERLKVWNSDTANDDACIVINPPTSHFIVRNCDLGYAQAPVSIRNEPGGKNRFIAIYDNEIHHGRLAGILGSADDCLIENNYMHDNGDLHQLTHAIYYGASLNETRRAIMRCNVLLNTNIDGDGFCVGGNLTFRGALVDTVIEDNVIDNPGGKFTSNAWGVSHRPGYSQLEYHLRTIIRRNYTRGMQTHYTWSSAPGIIVKDNEAIDNGVVGESPPSNGYTWPDTNLNPPDVTRDDAAQVTGNSFMSIDPRNGSRGLITGGGIGADNSAGDDVVIDGNRFEFANNGEANVYAMTLSEAEVAYASISGNTRVGGAGWTSAHPTLAAFESHFDGLGVVCEDNVDA